MSPTEIDLVHRTWAEVQPIKETAAELFYGRLFTLDPRLRPMFRGSMREQGDKLMATLGTVVAAIDQIDMLAPAARALAIRHVGYGVRPEHYDTVGAALMWTLQEGLGRSFTSEVKDAWTAVYVTVTEVMKRAAYSPQPVT